MLSFDYILCKFIAILKNKSCAQNLTLHRVKNFKIKKTANMGFFKKKAKPTNRIVRVVDKGSKEKVEKIKINKTLERDERFYEECFNLSNHKCEECGAPLPDQFRDEDGRIIARFRYSHVIPKSIAPELRWKIKNINHLCAECHTEWEHGDKINMKIFTENVKNFPNYLSKFID